MYGILHGLPSLCLAERCRRSRVMPKAFWEADNSSGTHIFERCFFHRRAIKWHKSHENEWTARQYTTDTNTPMKQNTINPAFIFKWSCASLILPYLVHIWVAEFLGETCKIKHIRSSFYHFVHKSVQWGPHIFIPLYMTKRGLLRGTLYFLIFVQNMFCVHSLERSQ